MSEHRPPEERREQVHRALISTIATRGLEQTTLRRVADAAGVSVGLVQRHFPAKADLLRSGIEIVYARTRQRVADIDPTTSPRAALEQLARALLPLDAERADEARVWLAFAHAALHDPQLHAVHLAATRELIDGIERVLATVRPAADPDPRAEALAFVAFLDGLVVNALLTDPPFDRAALLGALERWLDRLGAADVG